LKVTLFTSVVKKKKKREISHVLPPTNLLPEIEKFSTSVNSVIEMVETKANIIEDEKMRAIGLRNMVESEKELRKRKQKELQALIQEKQAELER
jgi:intraflagellar transport protein 20